MDHHCTIVTTDLRNILQNKPRQRTKKRVVPREEQDTKTERKHHVHALLSTGWADPVGHG